MHRRSLLTGLVTALAAPAIVRAESIMPLWAPKRGVDGVGSLDPISVLLHGIITQPLRDMVYAGDMDAAQREFNLIYTQYARHIGMVLSSMIPAVYSTDKEWAA